MTDKEKIRNIIELFIAWNGETDVIDVANIDSAVEFIASSLQEEPVSEEFEDALAREWQGYNGRGAATVDALEDNTQELAFAKGFYLGAEWKEQQFEKNRLAACDRQTAEDAEREQDFVMGIIEKEHRQPTFDDAIKYGMRLRDEQMLKSTTEAT